jgi:F420H(2)-dependent quinone reductase
MNSTVINEFRATGGKASGVFSGKPLILLHHIGAKSGTERITPLVPLLYDGRIFAFASKGGSDRTPTGMATSWPSRTSSSNSAPKHSRQQRGR